MESKPIPYSDTKTINKNLTFMNARKEPACWVRNKMNLLLMCPIYSAVTREDNWGLGTPNKVIYIILLLPHIIPYIVLFISTPITTALLI